MRERRGGFLGDEVKDGSKPCEHSDIVKASCLTSRKSS